MKIACWKNMGKNMAVMLAIFLGVTGSVLLLDDRWQVANDSLIMLFLLGVLFTTVATASIGWGVAASVLSLALFNYLFTEPRLTMAIHSSSDAMLLFFFLVTAVITGSVASRLRQQRDLAQRNAQAAHELMQVRAQQEFISLAMERERQRNILLRSVAHDLRSPLTALYGASCVLSEDYNNLDDGERKNLASHMTEEILWLTNLVENILNMTRITESGLRPRLRREAADDLISEAVRHTRPLLRGRSFSVSLPKQVLMLPVDGKLIEQVIINLLENAVRHTPESAAISLSADNRGQDLLVAVADTGPGVKPEQRQHIFDRFAMMDEGVTDSRLGLGLGLAICKAIVEAHGGSIWVEDNQPQGAKFCFTLPLGEQTEQEDEEL